MHSKANSNVEEVLRASPLLLRRGSGRVFGPVPLTLMPALDSYNLKREAKK
jgi:hypothetical protein